MTWLDPTRTYLHCRWRVDWRTYRWKISEDEVEDANNLAKLALYSMLPARNEAEAIRKRRTMNFGGAW